MPEIRYKDIRFSPLKLELIQKAIRIVTEYEAQGYDLTLRQVYYQFVARDWLPAEWADPITGSTNNQKSYGKLGDLLGDARMAGYMDWNSMVDRTRSMSGNTHWESPAAIINAVANQYRRDKWANQPHRPECWVEKDAMEGVVGRVCKRLDIPYFSCRGYTSLTSIWENAQRLKKIAATGAVPIILHLGDHDPSGIDMSRDIEDRVRLFMGGDDEDETDRGDALHFERIALNMDQVKEFNPPENPAKATDSRFKSYVDLYGDKCWELDALDPKTMDDLISRAVKKHRIDKFYKVESDKEATERNLLSGCSMYWPDVADFIRRQQRL